MIKDNYYVYIVSCSDNTFYTGITNNLVGRIEAHNNKKGAKYTRSRLPVTLLKSCGPISKSQALKIEYYIKQLPKEDKLNFTLFDYYKHIYDNE